MDDILVRPCADGDHIALAALVTALGYASSPQQLEARMRRIAAHPDRATFIAERAGVTVGMAGAPVGPIYEHDTPVGQITALAVAENARRLGVGRLLVARAEAWVRERGGAEIKVVSNLRRGDAHASYRAVGYVETGRRFVKRLGPSG